MFIKEQHWKICGQDIVLPKEHLLPLLQFEFPNYDKFLPFLARRINSGIFVDIGANIGDTAIAMLENTSASVITIEGDNSYIPYLKKNLVKYNGRWGLIHSFLGSSLFMSNNDTLPNNDYESKGGNTRIKKSHISRYPSLNKALDGVIPAGPVVRFIKSDIEGFDYLILSDYLQQCNSTPIIFFENEVYSREQMQEANEFAYLILNKGYNVIVFDNYGHPICGPCSPETLIGFNAILLRFKEYNNSPYTYIDVLAFNKNDEIYAIGALEDYLTDCCSSKRIDK